MYRTNRNNSGIFAFGGGTVIIAIVSLLCLALSWWTQGNLEWGMGKIAGHVVHVPLWLAMLLTFFTNMFGVMFNLICELLKLVFP